MGIQCKYCAAELPREDARFCNNCGMLVPSHPFSPQSLSASKQEVKRPHASSLPEQQGMPPEKLPETPQPARAEAASPSLAGQQFVRKPDSAPARPRSFQVSQQSPAWPVPVTHISMKETAGAEKSVDGQITAAAQDFEENKSIGMHGSVDSEEQAIEELPTSELQVPVEEAPQGDAAVEELPTRQEVVVPIAEASKEDTMVEELPTRHELAIPVVETSRGDVVVEEMPTRYEVAVPTEEELDEEVSIEDLPTRQVAAVKGSQVPIEQQGIETLPTSSLASIPFEQTSAEEATVQANAPMDSPGSYASIASYKQEEPSAFSPIPVISPAPAMAPIAQAPRPSAPARSPRILPLPAIIGIALLVILLAGGLVAWVKITQSLKVAPIVQPQVSFSDEQRGIALLYPNGWTKQVTADTVQFYASNHTADIDITVAANSSNVEQSLKQQAMKSGIGDTKAGAALPFAGETWQQLQGTVQQKGANYTSTMLATTHGGHLFIVMQQAPQGNYADWEKEFFAPMRSSFKFL